MAACYDNDVIAPLLYSVDFIAISAICLRKNVQTMSMWLGAV